MEAKKQDQCCANAPDNKLESSQRNNFCGKLGEISTRKQTKIEQEKRKKCDFSIASILKIESKVSCEKNDTGFKNFVSRQEKNAFPLNDASSVKEKWLLELNNIPVFSTKKIRIEKSLNFHPYSSNVRKLTSDVISQQLASQSYLAVAKRSSMTNSPLLPFYCADLQFQLTNFLNNEPFKSYYAYNANQLNSFFQPFVKAPSQPFGLSYIA